MTIKNKKLNLILLFLLSFLMIGAVGAASDTEDMVNSDVTYNEEMSHTSNYDCDVEKADVNTGTDILSEKEGEKSVSTVKINNNDNNDVGDKFSSQKDDLLASTDNGTFTALNDKINGGSNEISLEDDYYYTDSDSAFQQGILISDGKTITIHGNNHIIDAQGQARIFQLNNSQLILENLKLINGQGQYEKVSETTNRNVGGAIYLNNSNLTIINSELKNNNATYGGAISATNYCNITITNSNLTQNNATYVGGAIFAYNNTNLTIINSKLNNNNATQSGGVIYADDTCIISIINSKLNNNNATIGGTITLNNCDLIITNSKLNNNNALVGAGGIYLNNANLSIINSEFKNNNATYGGAILVYFNSILTVIDSQINNNTASRSGGAIYTTSNSKLNITNTTINNNNATFGGALYSYNATINIINTTINNNNATQSGGVIYATTNSQINITNTTINNNNATFGGALYSTQDSKLNITNTTINNNNAIRSGGAIYVYGSQLNMTHMTINNNTAPEEGGAIYVYYSQLNVTNTILINNKITGKHGWGGAICVYRSQLNVTNTILNNNKGTDKYSRGGAIYVCYSQLNINNSQINNNTSDDYGGAILSYDSSININNTTLNNNTSNFSGGVIAALRNSNLIITKSQMNNNKARVYGGVIYHNGGNLTIMSSLFTNNIAINGSSIYIVEVLNLKLKLNYNAFLNNSGTYEIYNETAVINYDINHNWFGNTVNNYTNKSKMDLNMETWLFLNATINPKQIIGLNQSNISFILNCYNDSSKSISQVDNDLINPINLTITSIKGTVDINNTKLGDNIIYAATTTGTGSVTANIENIEYMVKLTIKYPTQFIINNIPDFTEGSTIELNITEKNNYTGPVTVNIGTETYKVNIVNGTGKLNITPNLTPGQYNANIVFTGNENYTNTTTTSNKFTINKKPTPNPAITKQNTILVASNKVYKQAKYKKYMLTVKNKKGKLVKNTKVKLKIGKKTYTSKTNKKGVATFKIPNKKSKKSKKSKNWKIIAILNKNAKKDKLILKRGLQTNTAITNNQGKAVFKIKTKNKIRKYTITLKTTMGQVVKKQKVTLKVKGKTYNAKTNNQGKAVFKINNLNKNGKYKTKIKYNGNNNYNKSTKTIELTIKE